MPRDGVEVVAVTATRYERGMSRTLRHASWMLSLAVFAGCGDGSTEKQGAPNPGAGEVKAAAPEVPAAGGTAAHPVGVDDPLQQRLRAAAERMADAFTTMDLDVQVELTHPSVVAQLGGADAYRKVLERGKASLAKVQPPRGKIIGVDRVQVVGESAYAFVRFELEMTNMAGVRGVVDSYFAAESPADGSAWRFLDGSPLQGSLELLRKAIPAWPEDLPPPKVAGGFRKL